jgi:RimJ/RimL family protein N-acetyltransferase
VIITQPKELIGAFVNVRQGCKPDMSWGNFNALGLVRNGRLVAGVIYNCYEAANVNMHIGAIGSHWLTRQFLFAAFDYPFNQLNKRRATAMIRKKNSRTRKFAEHLGFVYEGTMVNYYADDDLICYGMLRENCRFLVDQTERKVA